jgi:Fungal specific transcription factor domain/Fungal Zn(2)-Cys(6) binuclear cluster domain
MRSSIACSRCRRSKIKCVNAGIDTTCRACEASGRECVYPAPAAGGGAAKRDIAATLDGDDRNAADWDNPKRQRSRKVAAAAAAAGKDGAKGLLDVLDSSVLSPKVWEALSKSFQTQFATILPFIDSTTLKNQTGQLSAETNPQSPPPRSQLSPLILLGVLTLTARFHPQLVVYHSPASAGNPSNPSAASEFYASALRARLNGPDGLGLVTPDLVHVQALLMLALHEWGMCRGKSAWLYVGIAIRLAQAMGLSYELENDPFSTAASSRLAAMKLEADHFGMVQRQKEHPEQSSDDVIVQETKRRTFWACFIMDRCLSSGKHRPRIVKVRDLDIQLPSDDAFAFGERVRTSKLSDNPARRASSFDGPGGQIPSLRQSIPYGEDNLRNGSTDSKGWSPVAKRMDSVMDHDIDRWEVGAQESLLSRVIRVIRIWGSIAKWVCAGGRR